MAFFRTGALRRRLRSFSNWGFTNWLRFIFRKARTLIPVREKVWHGSLALPKGYVKGAAGAGDAFCAGVLFGIHEEWPLEKCLLTGTCAATACMSDPTCTDGLRSLDDCWPWPSDSGSATTRPDLPSQSSFPFTRSHQHVSKLPQ